MRIAQVCPRYHPDIGGAETHVKEISERLAERGFGVEVICTDPTGRLPKHEMINGVKVTRFRSIAPNDAFFFAPQVYTHLKNNEYDIIHAHSYHAFPALFASLAKGKRKLVFTPHYHGGGHSFIRNLLHKPYRLIGSSIFEKADKVICVSRFEMDLVKEHFNTPVSKLICIPNGMNLDEFKEAKPIDRDYKTILFVGRLERYKGVQHIIQALPKLEGVRLEIIGKGPYEQELRKLADKLGVSDRIDWIKDIPRAELLQHYKSADVFVMPSQFEAYGITVAEALAAGTPCVVAETSALQEFVDDRMCVGIKYPIDTRELAAKIETQMNLGKTVETTVRLSSWDDVVDKLVGIYKS